MRIGIIGAGHIGGTAAKLFAQAGHDVAVSNSREPGSLNPVVSSIGPRAKATTPADAATFGDVILLAIPWRKMDHLPPAERLPGSRVVKAFNTMGWKTLETGGRSSSKDRLAIFVAGDDAAAKATVAKLIEEIGFAALDTGSLRDGGRRQQPGSPIYGRPMTASEGSEILRRRP